MFGQDLLEHVQRMPRLGMYPGDATDCWAMGGCDKARCAGAAGLPGDCLLPCTCNTSISEIGVMDCKKNKLLTGWQYAFHNACCKKGTKQ